MTVAAGLSSTEEIGDTQKRKGDDPACLVVAVLTRFEGSQREPSPESTEQRRRRTVSCSPIDIEGRLAAFVPDNG